MRFIAVLTSTAIATAATFAAKGPTAKLIIDRGDLAGMVEIVEPSTLGLANVYTGNFIDSSRGQAQLPAGLRRYEISFFLPDDRGSAIARFFQARRLYRAYVVSFAVDTARRTGYVYVPGADDTWSAWNHATIIRPTIEGHWSFATDAFTQRIADRIAHAVKRPPPRCPTGDPSGLLSPGDSTFADVTELQTVLEANGIHVLCSYHSTLDGMLGVPHAAGIATNLGWFHALFFPTARDAERVTVQSTVRNGQEVTVLRGPFPTRLVDSVWSADKTDFVIHGRWMFDTFGQLELRDALRRAVERNGR